MEVPAFRTFRIKDFNPLSGHHKVRVIHAPNPAMKKVHTDFIKKLRSFRVETPYSYGGVKKRSAVLNVRAHMKNRFFYLLDISNAYKNVECFALVQTLCAEIPQLQGTESKLYAFLLAHCFEIGGHGLLVGGPASPDLFNLYVHFAIDVKIGALCKQHGLTYTRFLDDLTISSPEKQITTGIRRRIRTFVEQAGFSVNHKKSFLLDLQRGEVVINGIGISKSGELFLPKQYLTHIRGLLWSALHGADVSREQIAGAWGVFSPIVKPKKELTRSEQKIVDLYRECRVRWNTLLRRSLK